ncbi:hypothetical protein DFH08DRAFT_390705 [Mycena albidolilacea]|uniref:Uncharacterized protein n=1 Tax=Mycena albidolilacea TaxID=1033008 RepID=A0AAD6ZF46_9AGAR|nr:hypothetical protein DFH08DRAFT_390705 [Mycena albidolilacea]
MHALSSHPFTVSSVRAQILLITPQSSCCVHSGLTHARQAESRGRRVLWSTARKVGCMFRSRRTSASTCLLGKWLCAFCARRRCWLSACSLRCDFHAPDLRRPHCERLPSLFRMAARVTGWRLPSLPLHSYLSAPSACACTSLAENATRATPASTYCAGVPSRATSCGKHIPARGRWPLSHMALYGGRTLAAGHRGWVRQLQGLVLVYRGHYACLRSRYRNIDGAIVLDLRH